jgi:hypothetical protein
MNRSRQAGCEPLRAACHLVSCGINRAHSRPAACLISLGHGMFWWDGIVWSTWNFFSFSIVLVRYKFLFCVLYLFQPNPILCVVIPRDNQTDRRAGLRREPYWGCQIGTLMNLLSVFSFPNFARLRNSAKKMTFFYCTKQRLDISGNPESEAVGGRTFNRFVSKMIFIIFSLFRHLWDVLTPF